MFFDIFIVFWISSLLIGSIKESKVWKGFVLVIFVTEVCLSCRRLLWCYLKQVSRFLTDSSGQNIYFECVLKYPKITLCQIWMCFKVSQNYFVSDIYIVFQGPGVSFIQIAFFHFCICSCTYVLLENNFLLEKGFQEYLLRDFVAYCKFFPISQEFWSNDLLALWPSF